MNPAVAFFDLDGTLARKPSCEMRHLGALLRQGHLGPQQVVAGLLFYPRWLTRYGLDVGRKNKAFLAGLSEATLRDHGEQWVADNADQLVPEESQALVDDCRGRGLRLVLMTGTPDFLAEAIARQLGMDECIATQCTVTNGRLRALPPRQHPYAKAKLELARSWCDRNGVDLAQCAAYGDSIQDAWLLNAVGMPVAVNPDRQLRRLATERRWRIVDTRR